MKMKNKFILCLFSFAALLVGCKEDTVTPNLQSIELEEFLSSKTITSSVGGKDIVSFDADNNQFNIVDKTWEIIDNNGFELSLIELNSVPVKDGILKLTFKSGVDNPTIYEGMKVVDIKNGLVYLWNNEDNVGFIIPHLI